MEFSKSFRGVPNGKIYPAQFKEGDECPPELEAAALEAGALKAPEPEKREANGSRHTRNSA